MARSPSAIHKLPDHIKNQLLYYVAELAFEKKISHTKIAYEMFKWVKENAPDYLNPEGAVGDVTVRNYIQDAVQKDFVKLSRFQVPGLVNVIRDKLKEKNKDLDLDSVKIYVAPRRDLMLRYVWDDLDKFLCKKLFEEQLDELIIGVSGGHTMLEYAELDIPHTELEWFHEVTKLNREKAIVCSLTSGGIRTDIAALSDMVAAHISNYLGTQVHGFLGPAWFASEDALKAFSSDRDVSKHKELIDKVDIILTSVGSLSDSNCLLRQLLRQLLSEKGELQFIEAHKSENVSDILYNCYNGLTGDDIELPPKVAEGLDPVINIDKLSEKVSEGVPCLVLASGKNKGHCIPGILKRNAASHIYLDQECANSLIEII